MPIVVDYMVFDQPEQYAVIVKRKTGIGQLQATIQEGYQILFAYLQERSVILADVPYVCYHDFDLEDIDLEMGLPVAYPMMAAGEVEFRTIPAGKVATCIFQGPYSELGTIYDQLSRWIIENHYEVAGLYYEYYLNDPDRPESEYLTKLVLPLK